MTETDQASGAATEPLCAACGGAAVVRDAWASWSPTQGQWELHEFFDHTFCLECDGETSLVWRRREAATTARVRALNDRLRTGRSQDGHVLITPGLQERGAAFVAAAWQAVAAFEAFTDDNDPHGEHDFGALEVAGERLFFKIDYYDQAMRGHSPDAADPAVTTRVLTIMLASEY